MNGSKLLDKNTRMSEGYVPDWAENMKKCDRCEKLAKAFSCSYGYLCQDHVVEWARAREATTRATVRDYYGPRRVANKSCFIF